MFKRGFSATGSTVAVGGTAVAVDRTGLGVVLSMTCVGGVSASSAVVGERSEVRFAHERARKITNMLDRSARIGMA